MSPRDGTELRLGSAAVQHLLRQRRPMLMVDFVDSYRPDPVPTLTAGRHISGNEVFFDGHFPDLPLWPAALTLEGLGQSATILTVLTMLTRHARSQDRDPAEILEALRNLDRGYRLHPGYRAEETSETLQQLRQLETSLAVGASVNLKFTRPVLPGCRLDYHVRWTDTVGEMMRFAAEAVVEGETVASGTLTGAWTRWTIPRGD